MATARQTLLTAGTYPDAVPAGFCPGGFLSGCGFFGDSVIVRFAKNHQAPYGIQTSLSLEFEPLPDTTLRLTYLRVKGVHLGSFFNVNQPNPTGKAMVHDSHGNSGFKNTYFFNVPGVGIVPGTRDPRFAVYFEADSLWNSVFDGLLVNVNKRLSHQATKTRRHKVKLNHILVTLCLCGIGGVFRREGRYGNSPRDYSSN